MIQHGMIDRLRERGHADHRIMGVLMFGSFPIGEGDVYSDIEFALFIRDDAFTDFDQHSWLSAISPVDAYFPDDFGHHTALFEIGVRGEFHFKRTSEMPIFASWQGHGWFPSLASAVLLDRTGELSKYASALVGGPPPRGGPPLVEGLVLNLINLMLFGTNLLNRGEVARAWALLGRAHENRLKLVRLDEQATDHWPTPSRALENDLSTGANERYLRCTASAQPRALGLAYRETWIGSRELFGTVAGPLEIRLPPKSISQVERLLDEAIVSAGMR